MALKIISFGKVSADAQGGLVVEGFTFDAEGGNYDQFDLVEQIGNHISEVARKSRVRYEREADWSLTFKP